MYVEKITSKLLYRLYGSKRQGLREIIKRLVMRAEGGQIYSTTLRRIYLDYYHINVGLYSYGGCFDETRIAALTNIGRYCCFAEGVCVFNRNHPIRFKSMHPFFYNSAMGYVQKEMIDRHKVFIGNDVWIGRNAIILPSVRKIGDGAVVGAGAVVTRDIPDFAIVAGNPAEIIRYRFSVEVQRKIKKSQWWNKDIEELQQNMEEFNHPLKENMTNFVDSVL